jgi:hypothetical protein
MLEGGCLVGGAGLRGKSTGFSKLKDAHSGVRLGSQTRPGEVTVMYQWELPGHAREV